MNNGAYNNSNTQMVYAYRGDLYWVDLKTNKTVRITQTEETESSPRFILQDEWIVFTKSQNLFGWHIRSGITQQLTNLVDLLNQLQQQRFKGEWLGQLQC
ncbi:MAG: DPP IV N-terminal domain-containing protein [Sediminibacterium sp.]|nr:DPP IV N-terminal domain-containing protein [Sediminibacterium sp.]